jgi:3-hydroxyisobutyrate dehydrogenase
MEGFMKVGTIGTGLMGQPMAMQLLDAGQSLVAYNRTPAKLDPLKTAGAEIADSPAALLSQCDCVVLMVSDAAAIREVLFGGDCKPHLSGCTIIQMSTIGPEESRQIGQQVQANGGDYLEAPVLGSVPQAKSGTLQVMVGGTTEQYQKWHNVLSAFGKPMHIGEVGTAAAMKLGLNQLIASLTSAFALSLGFVKEQGVDVEKFMEILRESALYAPTFDKKLNRMLDGNYENPNFPTKHLLKDTNLFLKEAESTQVNARALEGVRAILEQAQQQGWSESDYSAIFAAIQSQNRASQA